MLKNVFILAVIIFCNSSLFADNPVKAKIDLLVNRIKERNSLLVFYQQEDIPPPNPPTVDYNAVSDAEYRKLLTYMELLQCELNKIPKQTAINSGLRVICLIKDFEIENKIIDGLAIEKILFLDCMRPNTDQKRHVVHHEFFHVLDKAYNGPDATTNDPAWSALNEPDFEYNKNGDFTITRWYSGYIDHPQKGFVNKYSMTKPGEDKAEIYAALMRPDQAKTVDGWARSDEVLARKIRYIRKFSLMASKHRGTASGPDPNANS